MLDIVKASEVSICIFTPTTRPAAPGRPYESAYPADEQAIWRAFAPVVQELRQKHGGNAPIFMDFCPLTIPENQLIVAQQGIADLPAVQVFAKYPDGSTGVYYLTKDIQDKLTGINWTPDDVRRYVEAVLYQREGADSLLCKLFPPLCSVGKYVWLAVAGYATFKTLDAESPGRRAAFGVAAALTWMEFAGRGGFKDLAQKKLNP